MNEISQCKEGTLPINFIESGGNGVRSEYFKLNRTSRRSFIWRSLFLLSVVLIFSTRFLILKYLESNKNFYVVDSYVGRSLNSVVQTTTTPTPTTTSTSTPPTTAVTTEKIHTNSTTSQNLQSLYIDQNPNCTAPAILGFPPDGLTRKQRRHGWILIHMLLALYCFWLLAIICDDYFVPAIEQICSKFGMQKDVIAATFMAAATSSPELFMNCVGTFVTQGDIGISTIVGTSVFNILAVPACCGFCVLGQFVKVDWWPVTRDCLMYCAAILALIATIADGRVMWYEALLLIVGYFFYLAIMYYNDEMAQSARKLMLKYRHIKGYRPFHEVSELTPLLIQSNKNIANSKVSLASEVFIDSGSSKPLGLPKPLYNLNSQNVNDNASADNPWGSNGQNSYEYACRWPITFILWLTIPDSRKHPNWKYATFLLSISWMGLISYFVAYLITIIGDTLDIPDSVMGLTILAAGISVPDAVTSIIVTRQGQGAMGISNSLGANTFDILLCLGIPWFVKAYFLPTNAGQLWVTLNSTGFTYSTVCLLTTLFGLFIAFVVNRFILDWKMGVACSVMYIGFMIIASMIELNVFFPVNLPICKY